MQKRTVEEYLEKSSRPILNLGCGKTNVEEMYGVDITDNDGVDKVMDAQETFPFDDNTFDVVYARDLLEHLIPQKSIHVMEEIYRVLKPEGQLEFIVPSTDGNNTAAFQDPTHYSFWPQMKFRYFYDDSVQGSFRQLYDINCHFIPLHIETYFNEWNITYVRGVLQKKELSE